ncbi:anti-sigma factor [Rhodococcoides corynebacterioides]|uniref:Regulator of SigK n=1 Tax=Rhodococcoides corynebacterioides TaxID=53972 RepID=A0ABS7NYQ5_9NOCA|nr:anti-sigma factor [Rhodococcus corynebacterioides]MBY6365262.1 anti-sigma factor [Rhodococcus corynebacterioides]MBY6406674.1 anti-sigma factor [Rhodococcus corynebacterioides]
MNDRAPRSDGRRFVGSRREPDPDLIDLAYLCALDAMSASERFETMTRLGEDDVTRRRFDEIVRDIRETMAISAYTTDTPAPPDLRTRILGAAADTAQVAPDGTPAPVVVPFRAGESRRARRIAPRWAAAAAAAVVVVGVGGAIAVGTSPDATAPTAVTALDAPVAGGGTLEVEYTPGADRAVLHMDGVDAPPAGSVYQVWVIDGSPVSVGTMDATTIDEAASVPVAGASAVSITVEPTGGSPFPTSAAIARVDLT